MTPWYNARMRGAIRVAIAGATGYGGVEAVRLLSRHPHVQLAYLGSQTYAGQDIAQVYPHLANLQGVAPVLRTFDPVEAAQNADVVFLALRAGQSMDVVPQILERGAKVIDFSPDFRVKRADLYHKYYKIEHRRPDLLAEACYGLPELHRREIAAARLVAAPGCYSVSAILPIVPLLRAGLVSPDDMIVDSKSGVSGAGRTALELQYHFPEANEDVTAYQVTTHRHTPEMEQEIGDASGREVRVTFTPHLIPITRGIFTVVYARMTAAHSTDRLLAALREAYSKEPFVRVMGADAIPHTKATVGSNYCHLTARADERTGRALALSAIDNLGKGLAGVAVQCMNIMFGLPETTGLEMPGAYP